MVLDHVAQRADGVVEPAAALDAEVLGHRDLHVGNALPIPELGQREVGEPQVLQPDDRFLAEEVVDEQDLVVAQHMVQPGVQFARRVQVVAERFLDRDPAVAQEPGRSEVLDDRAEKRRRHFQVEQRPLAVAHLGSELAVQRAVGDVTGQVGDPAGEPAENRVIQVLAESATASRA